MDQEKRFEKICSLAIAIFAAALAVTNIWGNKFSDDVIIAYNEKTNAYEWYNSKGIKQNLAEGQKDILGSLLTSGVLDKSQEKSVTDAMAKLDKNIIKYKKEKNEILKGSKAVGKENWVQDVNGEMGVVIGANEWEAKAKKLYDDGDTFNLAILLLEITLVIGAINLILKTMSIKKIGLVIMIVLGSSGIIAAAIAFFIAFQVR